MKISWVRIIHGNIKLVFYSNYMFNYSSNMLPFSCLISRERRDIQMWRKFIILLLVIISEPGETFICTAQQRNIRLSTVNHFWILKFECLVSSIHSPHHWLSHTAWSYCCIRNIWHMLRFKVPYSASIDIIKEEN